MAEFINTIDVLGDDAVVDSIINRTITEFKDDKIVTIGNRAFYGCSQLSVVDMPNVEDWAEFAFENCTALTEVSFPNVQYFHNGIFRGCTALKNVNLPELKGSYISSYANSLFYGCKALERIVLPKLTRTGNTLLSFCTSLKVIDLPALEVWGNGVCQGCSKLDTIILRNPTTVATMGETNNNIDNSKIAAGTGYIYVPRALVDSYKAATNWSTYATQFRALEDYTVDGTITGELDETKI